MVGTDLVQAIPLVGAAALGHLLFGKLDFSIIGSVLIGAIPAVIVGAHFSSKGADRLIRPVLVAVLAISSLGLLGVSNGWLLATAIASVVILAVVITTMVRNDRRNVAVTLGGSAQPAEPFSARVRAQRVDDVARGGVIGNGTAGWRVEPCRRATRSFSRSGSRMRPVQAPWRSQTAEHATQVNSNEPPEEISTSTWAPS